MKLEVGDSVAISFDTEPGVGFEWSLASNKPAGVLAKTGDREAAVNVGLVGGPATHVYTFKAQKPGPAALGFHHSYRGKPRGNETFHVAVSASG